jgi:hypothetical protein
VALAPNTSTNVTLTGSDPTGRLVSFIVTGLPAHGSLSDGVTPITAVPFQLSGKTVTFTPTTGYTGADAFTFAVKNASHTSSVATVSLNITSLPSPVINTPAANSWQTAAITFSGTTSPGSSVQLYEGTQKLGVASKKAGLNGAWTIRASVKTAGSHTVTAVATDAVLGSSPPSAGRTFQVDATAPNVTVETPTANQIFLEMPASASGSASDDGGSGLAGITIVYSGVFGTVTRKAVCNGAACAWSDTYAVPTGVWDVKVTAKDVAGNVTTIDVGNILVVAF